MEQICKSHAIDARVQVFLEFCNKILQKSSFGFEAKKYQQ